MHCLCVCGRTGGCPCRACPFCLCLQRHQQDNSIQTTKTTLSTRPYLFRPIISICPIYVRFATTAPYDWRQTARPLLWPQTNGAKHRSGSDLFNLQIWLPRATPPPLLDRRLLGAPLLRRQLASWRQLNPCRTDDSHSQA